MLIKVYQAEKEYTRASKKGIEHSFKRKHSMAVLICDCCGTQFERRVRDMDHRRVSSDHYHICPACPSKKVAQKKAVESRKFWNTTVDNDIDINSL